MHKLLVSVDGYTFEVELNSLPVNGSGVLVRVKGGGESRDILVASPDPVATAQELEWFIIDDHPYEVAVDPDMQWIRSRWGIFPLKIEDLDSSVHRPHISDGRVKAPIPGQITQVLVKLDEEVSSDQTLLILEAMKMENEIRAPHSGRVKLLNAAPGRRVALNELLVEIE
jgi:acetyl/propionyl-CoA carboxylase alpha subunit